MEYSEGVLLTTLGINTASIAVRKDNICELSLGFKGNRFNLRFNLLMARQRDNNGMGCAR